ncbi:MFS transporter [Nocardia panacis]|uniref:MFS transporter n=1 Tax=Nocardia panacis TaxID=2340916 RepID=UPI00131569B7|nr:MFS transporter [Nocardia panacis]
MSTLSTQHAPPAAPSQIRTVAWASAIGSTIEWYDFFLYGTAAALVFDKQFFPALDPVVGTIAAFGTLAVGFGARILGGLIFGHFGDRIGRRTTLIVSLLVMGLATVGIGLLPNYDRIGVAAPLLLVLLRVVQGIGLGGEWGGAVVLTLEHAPDKRRGLWGSFPQLGTPAGLLLANGAFLACSTLLDRADYLAWGWRIPFLLSVVLIGIGLYLRVHVQESPEFVERVRHDGPSRAPLRAVLVRHWRRVLLAAIILVGNSAVSYVFMVYMLSYGAKVQGLSKPFMLAAVIAGTLAWLITSPLWALAGDRFGLRDIFVYGTATRIAWSLVFFPVVDTGNRPLIIGYMVVMGVIISMTYAPVGTLAAGFFPVDVRYSGASIAYQIASLLGGGITPLVAASIYAATGTSWSITAYTCVISLLSLLASLAIPRE